MFEAEEEEGEKEIATNGTGDRRGPGGKRKTSVFSPDGPNPAHLKSNRTGVEPYVFTFGGAEL